MTEIIAYCLASSSEGNCYIYDFKEEEKHSIIMVECGIPFNEILSKLAKLQINIIDVQCCLITHAHRDHSYAVKELIKCGIPIYCSEMTANYLNIESYRMLKSGYLAELNENIKVIPFEVIHDIEGCLGFFIFNKDKSLLFINDSYKVPFDLTIFKPTIVFIECNYEDKITHILYNQAKKNNDKESIHRYERILKAHMGVYGCKKVLSHIDLTSCKFIALMHLSDRNSNEYKMKEEIYKAFKIRVGVCQKRGGIK